MSKGEAEREVPPVIREIVAGLDRDLMSGLKATRAIDHPGESGRAREGVVRDALRRIIPDGFGVDTGFVVDAVGGKSRQVDIIIYRRNYHPTFAVGGVTHYIAESVAAAIENKASISSRDELRDAIDAVTSVKRLDRTAGGMNYYLDPGAAYRQPVDPDVFHSQVFTAVVTEKGLTREVAAEVLDDHLEGEPRRHWLNIFVCLDSFATLYRQLDGGVWTVRADTMMAREVVFSRPEVGRNSPFQDFMLELLNFLRVAMWIDYSTAKYLPARTGFDFGRELPPPGSETPSPEQPDWWTR